MNKLRKKPITLNEAKIQAAILQKMLSGKDPQQAAKRFQKLQEFAKLSVTDILHQKIKHKHALAVIAMENGFNSWLDLKIQIRFIIGGHLNLWFSKYNEAKSHLKSSGGYLLAYKNQFFICDANYIKQIGFDPEDPNWKLIGFDWAVPENKEAWQRLYKKWSQESQAKGDRDE